MGFAGRPGFMRRSPKGTELFQFYRAGEGASYFVDLTRIPTAHVGLPITYLPGRCISGAPHQLQFGIDGQRIRLRSQAVAP